MKLTQIGTFTQKIMISYIYILFKNRYLFVNVISIKGEDRNERARAIQKNVEKSH